MASIKAEKIKSSTDVASGTVEEIDIEQYINPDSFSAPSPTMSPDSSAYKTSPENTPSSNPLQYPTNQTETFAGPSHQYDQYRQQASLPVGAIANTFALNESAPYTFGQDNYNLLASNSYLGSNIADDYLDLDIGASADQLDMDGMDFSLDPTQFASSGGGVPTTNPVPRFQSSSTQHVRAWPGMHQQAAEQAKAQAEAQRQNQAKRQSQSLSRESTAGRSHAEDPHVEESISRLLHRMRHSSVSTSNGDDSNALANSSLSSQGAKSRKEEEDMDEDERLLASEEGKKLSSKERRQLRNKVSARAFRSRRKEYIGQLEGELAGKAAEADRLRTRNEQLTAENSRLTDLTRMLLSSPHFSTFLDELSANRGTIPSFGQVAPQPSAGQQQNTQQQQRSTQAPKDANPISQQTNLHIGLATIPESSYESNMSVAANSGWTQASAFDQRVFALTEIPQEPMVDAQVLSGKSVIESKSAFGTKEDLSELHFSTHAKCPQLPSVSTQEHTEHPIDETVAFDESDSAFVLFSDAPQIPSSAEKDVTLIAEQDGALDGNKIIFHITTTTRQSKADASTAADVMCRLEQRRGQMDRIGSRIEKLCVGL